MQKKYTLKIVVILLGVLPALLLNSCAKGQEQDSTVSDAPELLLRYGQTGGLRGTNDQLDIMSNGECTLKQRDKETQFTLSADELSSLNVVLKDCYPDPPPEDTGGPKRVAADYITYTFKTESQEFSYTDMDIPVRIRDIVIYLNKEIIQRSNT